MKKHIIFFMVIAGLLSRLNAAGLYDIDWESKVFRSSVPAVATSDMLLTTGTIAVYGIMVSSPVSGSCFTVYNSSSSDSTVDVSSFFYLSPATGDPRLVSIKKVFNKGIRWSFVGSGKCELLWDWVGKPPLASYDSKGRY